MIHYIATKDKPMMKELEKIQLSDLRTHMQNNFRCHYFISGPLGEVEIAGCTRNFWCYPLPHGRAFPSKPEAVVTVRMED